MLNDGQGRLAGSSVMYDPIADLKLAAAFVSTIETGQPLVDFRIKALAATLRAVAETVARGPLAAGLFEDGIAGRSGVDQTSWITSRLVEPAATVDVKP